MAETLGEILSPRAKRQRKDMFKLASILMSQAEEQGIPTDYDKELGWLTLGNENFVLSDEGDWMKAHEYSMRLKESGRPEVSAGRRGTEVGTTASPDVFGGPSAAKKAAMRKALHGRGIGFGVNLEGAEEVTPGSGVYSSDTDAITSVESGKPVQRMAQTMLAKLKSGEPLSAKELALVRVALGRKRRPNG